MESHQTTTLGWHPAFPQGSPRLMLAIRQKAEDLHGRFADWAYYGQFEREEAGTLLSAEEALREDLESFEVGYIKMLGHTPEVLCWHNLRQNLARSWRRANFYPLPVGPHWHYIPTLQEFFHGIPKLNLPTNPTFTTLHNAYNDYGRHLKTLNWPDLAEEFQTYRERWAADARRSLNGEPRSESWANNLLIEDYKWMLWRFDTLFQDAPAHLKEDAKPTVMESQEYLRSAIKLAESGGMGGNLLGEKLWDSLKLAYKKAYLIAWGHNPPEHMDVMLRRPSEMREVESWIFGPDGTAVSTGVTFLRKEQP
jgi:hypothetical protein